MIVDQENVLRTLFFALEEGEVIAESRDDWDSMDWTGLPNHDALIELSLRLMNLPITELREAFDYTALYGALSTCLPERLSGLFEPSRIDAYNLGQIMYVVLDSSAEDFGVSLGEIAVSLDEDMDEEIEAEVAEFSESLQLWFESDARDRFLQGVWESSETIRDVLKSLSER